jgi:hypothetical protein
MHCLVIEPTDARGKRKKKGDIGVRDKNYTF